MRQRNGGSRSAAGRVGPGGAGAVPAWCLLVLALLGCEHGVRLLGPYDGGEPPWPDGADADAPDGDGLDVDGRRDDVHDPDGELDGEPPPFDGRFERPDGYCPLPGDPNYTYTENGAYAPITAAGPAQAARRRPQLSWGTIGGGCDNPIFDLELDDSCRPEAIEECAFASPELQVFDLLGPRWISPSDLPVATGVPVGSRYAWRLRGCCPGNCCTEWNRPRYVEVGRQPNDVNGDGYGDLLVGAPGGAGSEPGAVYLFLGGPEPDESAEHVLRGPEDRDRFGTTVAWLRDLDADGFADLGVAAPGAQSVLLFRGSARGVPEPFMDYGLPDLPFGAGPAPVGDFDADGYADAAVVLRTSVIAEGGLIVLRGGPRSGEYVWSLLDTGPAYSGRAVAGVGDHRGWGHATIAVGEPGSAADYRPGAVGLYHGATNPDEIEWDEFSVGWDERRSLFAQTVAAAGDVNEDGFDDILVGEGEYPGSAAQALVFFGPLPPGWPGIDEPSVVGRSPERGAGFADAVAGGGDVNGDRHLDLLVGAPGERGVGCVHLYLGSGTLAGFGEVVFEAPVGAPARFGAAVALVPDVNGDGHDDVLVGAPGDGDQVGAAYLYLGGTAPSADPALELRGRDAGDRFGASVN